jgi:serine/threonine-protein kinase
MGRVELALRKEGAFKRLYAVKRLHSILVSDTAVREMFMEEARIAGLIRHPNVVSVLDVGEDADGPFLIMDYVEGASLASLLKRASAAESPIPIQVCVRIAREIALGLHAAHELVDHDGARLDVVHRDLSPQNVLFGFDGAVRITDFGIAKALGRSVRTSTGVLKGKLSYMSPEQLQFEEPDRRSDLFFLFELLAKEREKRPVDAKTVATRLDAVLAELVASEGPFELGGWLDGFAGDFRRERQAALAAAIAEAETRTPPKANGRSWRGPVLVAVALAAVAAAIGVAASAWTDVSGAPDLAAPASARASGDVRPLAHRESAGSSSVELAREETPTEPAEATQSPETDPQVATPELEIETPRDRGRSRSTRRRTPRPVMAMTQAVATVMTQATPPVTMTVTMAQREDGWDDWNSP